MRPRLRSSWERVGPIGHGAVAGLTVVLMVNGVLLVADLSPTSAVGTGIGLCALAGYAAAGYIAGAVREPMRGGFVAGLIIGTGSLALLLVAWLVRQGPFLTGVRAKHPAIVIAGPFVFACAFAVAGAALRKRRDRVREARDQSSAPKLTS
jgi:hypothetical protein